LLEKPNIKDDLIISRLQADYGLRVAELTFLPLGADMGTVVYRVVSDDGTAYFLKLRKNFNEVIVRVPLLLKEQGNAAILVPFETRSKQRWADFGEYKLILYPFVEGRNGFEMELTHQHWRTLGMALRQIHSAPIPSEINAHIQRETFSPQYRASVRSYQKLIEYKTFDDPIAAKLAEFMLSQRDEITRLVNRTESLAAELQSQPLELVISHGDLHGGNVLISDEDKLYIIDWDGPMLSQKEHDLMFIGAGLFPNDFNHAWEAQQEEVPFYEGYGKTEINLSALAYYRYDRILNDFSAYCDQLLLTDEGGIDREPAFEAFISNFKPGSTIALADATGNLLP